jgi:cytochrome P450
MSGSPSFELQLAPFPVCSAPLQVAGSDTTGSTLAFVFYQLLSPQNKEWLKQLQDEVEPFRGTTLANDKLVPLPILNAVINETLRFVPTKTAVSGSECAQSSLMPVVPHRTQRVAPAGGLQLGDKFVPGGTVLSVPIRGVLHDARSFSQPKEWRPQRWIDSEKESVFDRRACSCPFVTFRSLISDQSYPSARGHTPASDVPSPCSSCACM